MVVPTLVVADSHEEEAVGLALSNGISRRSPRTAPGLAAAIRGLMDDPPSAAASERAIAAGLDHTRSDRAADLAAVFDRVTAFANHP